MPVTKTAKRALRVSQGKALVNKLIRSKLLAAIRIAKKTKTPKAVTTAVSLTDRAAKKKLIHKNKAARIKSALAKLLAKTKPAKPRVAKAPKSKTKKK